MKKSFRGIAAALALALAGLMIWPAVMSAQVRTGNGYYFFFQLTNEYDEPFTTDGFANCSIYSYNDNGSIYSYTHSASSLSLASAQAGPLYSNTNGIIHWYSSSTNPVDVACYTKGGDSARKVRMSIREHKLRIVTSGAEKVVRFPFVGSATAPTATGIYIPEGSVVTNVGIRIDTVGATAAHINVSFGGNHAVSTWNALANRVSLSTSELLASPVPGFKMLRQPSGQPGTTHPMGANHLGLALRHVMGAIDGVGGATAVYNGGYMVHVTGGLELYYNTASIAPAGGHVYVFFKSLHTGSVVTGAGY